jgi:hypothetical protein
VVEYVGQFHDPFLLAFRTAGPKQHLYRVSIDMNALWQSTGAGAKAGAGTTESVEGDRIHADVYQDWLISAATTTTDVPAADATAHLVSVTATEVTAQDHHHHHHEHEHEHEHEHHAATATSTSTSTSTSTTSASHRHDHRNEHEHGHNHSHDHGHVHESRYQVECTAVEREQPVADRPGKIVIEALLRILYRKEIFTPGDIHRAIERLESANVKMLAKELVIKAWQDEAFKQRLLADGT